MNCCKCGKAMEEYDFNVKAFGKQKDWLVPRKWTCECGQEWKQLNEARVKKDLNKAIQDAEKSLAVLNNFKNGLAEYLPGEYANALLATAVGLIYMDQKAIVGWTGMFDSFWSAYDREVKAHEQMLREVDIKNQEIIDQCMEDHMERVSLLPIEAKIVRTYPRLHRIGKSNKVLLEMCTEYLP